MATRSRTALFLQLRQSNPSASTGARGHPVLETEKIGLISESISQPTADLSAHVNDDAPPAWLHLVQDIEATIDRIHHQLSHLESLHKKNLLPGFDDHSDTETSIDQTTSAVTAMFRQCQKLIKQFEAALNSNKQPRQSGPSPHEVKLHKNIASSLASRVSTLSTQFRKSQSNYMARLKSRTVLSSPLFALSDIEDDMGIDSPRASAFTQVQEQQVAQNDQVIREREREIEGIAKTIGEIAELFRDMQAMVVEQGSLMDRIDYNLTVAASNVERGNEELVTAQGYQVAARKKMLIFLLILAILFVIILLAIRRRK